MAKEMEALVSRFAEYLRRSEQQLRCFHKYESQVEGWFKGELICFLEREKLEGRLHDFGRERQVYYNDTQYIKVDIVLQFDNRPSSWVELKHWIGYYNDSRCDSKSYFRVDNETCIKRDVEKLLTIPEDGDKFVLVAFTPNPDYEDWNSGVETFNTKFPHLSVRSLTNPGDYPDYFFLGLLHVGP